MQDRIFYSACFGFAIGIFFYSFILVNFYLALWLLLISAFIIFFYSFVRKNPWGIIGGAFLLALSLGLLRFSLAESHLPSALEGEHELIGIVVDDPDIREANQKLTVETNDTNILVTTGFDTDYAYGDEVKISGEVKKPENFLTDQGKEFDYINYLKKDGIFYVMSYPEVEIISHGHGNWLKAKLFDFKNALLAQINNSIYSPESLLMGGLILGERSPFSDELRQSFVDTGTIHIVALSGYNVTIVADWFMKLFFFLPLLWSISIGILLILLFVLMTGGSSTAIRSGIMATLSLIARATGRSYEVTRGLILAGTVMLLFNPYLLVFDVSFQLSFIATVAVIFVHPRIEKHFQWVTKSFGLREILSMTVAAYIFVLPFILYKMGNLSLVAIPANFLVLPFVPFTMALGFVTAFLGVIWAPLAVPAGILSYIFLHYELSVINFFASFPFASITLPNFPLIITLAIYTYYIYRLFRRSIKRFFILSGDL
jgi:competence protein ComEC